MIVTHRGTDLRSPISTIGLRMYAMMAARTIGGNTSRITYNPIAHPTPRAVSRTHPNFAAELPVFIRTAPSSVVARSAPAGSAREPLPP